MKEFFIVCDNLWDVGLLEFGVKFDDKEGGVLWKFYDVDELKKEIAREYEVKEEKERVKCVVKEEVVCKVVEKEVRVKVLLSEMFKMFSEYEGLYFKYDDDGVSTYDVAGEVLAKSAVKKLFKLC